MKFSIQNYIAQDGERFSFLFSPDDPGIPMFYPCAYTSRHLRASRSHQTQLVSLDAIRRMSEWERERGISIEDNIRAGALFSPSQVDDLASHVRTRRNTQAGEVITSRKFNIYWGYISDYIHWLTDELLPKRNDIDVRKLVEDQRARFKLKLIKRKGSQARHEQVLLDEKLSEDARAILMGIFHEPLQGGVLLCNRGTRIRNIIMLRILYETGMRRGELLSLKLKHFIEASGGDSAYLVIERNHHDEYDSRTNQPVAKTAGRTVPISEELELQILNYRTDYRAELINVGYSDDDFIFVVHRSGKTQGHALTTNGFNSVFTYLKNTFPLLGNRIHAHAFRHDWNYRFSLHADEKGFTEKVESEMRAELMGWALGSNMAKIYNRRHTRNKAMEAGRAVARDTERPKK